jgi:hypothetical protein
MLYCVMVAGDSGFERLLSAPWYKEFTRIGVFLPLIATPLIVLTFVEVLRALEKFFEAKSKVLLIKIAFSVVVIVSILFLPESSANAKLFTQIVQSNFGASESSQFSKKLYSYEKDKALDEIAQITPSNALIIADPYNGSSFLYSMKNRDVVFRTVNPNLAHAHFQKKVLNAFESHENRALTKTLCKSPEIALANRPLYLFDFGKPFTTHFKNYKLFTPLHKKNYQRFIESGELSKVAELPKSQGILFQIECK